MSRSGPGVCFALFLAAGVPSMAGAQGGIVDVVVVAESEAEGLAAGIASIGGVVTHRYEHVPALVARVPATRLAQLRALPGVASVEKDGVMTIEPPQARADRIEGAREIAAADLGGTVEPFDVRSRAIEPQAYLNYLLTGAAGVWTKTDFGAGSVVAVVDSGTHPVFPCLDGAVIGAPGFPDGYDAIGDNPATANDNHPHGTWVGGTIASACALTLPDTHPLIMALKAHAPSVVVPASASSSQFFLLGVAPGASLYPVKVFPKGALSTATSAVLKGLDHVLGMKKTGQLDIDVVNLSLGGGTLWDGRDAYDRFVNEVEKAGIVVVASAGNSGPVPNTVGSPGTAFRAISVGATDEAVASRVFYEYLGLASGLGPGQGVVMRPRDETRIVNFSSRGPLSDGRGGPQIAALGTWNFLPNPAGGFNWVTGTSFASPTVAGAAALLNAWWEKAGRETQPGKIRNALIQSADQWRVGKAWRDVNDQGLGVLDVPAALEKLQDHHRWLPAGFPPVHAGTLEPNVLRCPHPGGIDRYRSHGLTLEPGVVRDFVFEIDDHTSAVRIDLEGLSIPDNSVVAFWSNALQVDVQSAKRSAVSRPVDTLLLDPSWDGASLSLDIEDGPWTLAGFPWASQPMEPGLMKLSLAGDFVNQSPVGVRARITRESFKDPLRRPLARLPLADSDSDYILFFDMPSGVSRATFDLVWRRDWSRFPTSDVDLVLFTPSFDVLVDAATLNAPERAVVSSPETGEWAALVDAFEVSKPDVAKFFVKLE